MIVALSAGAASAQSSRSVQEANAQWRRLSQTEVNCVDQALRTRNSNLWSLIQRGVSPSDPSAGVLRAGCRVKPGTSNSAAVTANTYQPSQAQAPQRETSREQLRGYWSLDGSTLSLVAEGDSRRFYLYQSEAQGTGATRGALLLEGKMAGTHFAGTAYKFSSQCGRVPYRVDGMFRDNNLRLELQGQSPRIDAYCVMQGTELNSLTLKALDSSLAKMTDAAAGKSAALTATTGKATVEKPAAEKPAIDKTVAAEPVEQKVVAAGPAAEKIATEKAAAGKTSAGEAAANPDVLKVAAVDVAEPVNTEPAKTEPIKTEPVKTGADGEITQKEATAIAAVISADLDTETRLSFVCGLLSGVATAGALALMFFARQRQRNAQAAAVPVRADERSPGGNRCQFDLLVRAVLAEQNRLHRPASRPDRATQQPMPRELVPG